MTTRKTRRVAGAGGKSKENLLTREDWIAAAKQALMKSGIGNLKVDRLAREMKVTRGSFYWHFKSQADLLDGLLNAWAHANTEPFLAVLERDVDNPVLQYRRFVEVWIRAKEFDADYDSAIRDWARVSPKVAKLVQEADSARMAALRSIFLAMGYKPVEADVRARITYYHQVGYYAMRIRENMRIRRALLPTYFHVLSGVPMPKLRRIERG